MTNRKGIGGRKRTGTLEFRSGSWQVRLTVDVDGETIRKWFDLETTSKAVARRKAAKLVAQHSQGAQAGAIAETAKGEETADEAAERVFEGQRKGGLRTWKDRAQRWQSYVSPVLGPKPVNKVRAGDVREVLESALALGKSRQTLQHIKNDMSGVFGALWRDELIAENPVLKSCLTARRWSSGRGSS